MRHPLPDTINRRIAENKRLSQKARLAALAALHTPSVEMLVRLLRGPETPSRIRTTASRMYEAELLKREVDRVLNEPQVKP